MTTGPVNGINNDKMTSVRNEKKKVRRAERNGEASSGLRVIGLKKTYFKKACGRRSKNDVHAVRGIWFEAADRELLAILGHNGAGKSTTFSMLTGVLEPTGGTAKVCGFDVRTEIDEIRKIMGVVPQFDILWTELTANEHMRMFSKIKGIPIGERMDFAIDRLLESVGLLEVKYARVANFSGGMKRRLSVAIASIGNPKIIFLDEPTTGMDPVSRRDVWNLV
jgi:ABC-type multidrug transport system ATPase subunit